MTVASLLMSLYLGAAYLVPMRELCFLILEFCNTISAFIFASVILGDSKQELEMLVESKALAAAQWFSTAPASVIGPLVWMALSLLRILLTKVTGAKLLPNTIFREQISLELQRIEKKILTPRDNKAAEEEEARQAKWMQKPWYERWFGGDASWELFE